MRDGCVLVIVLLFLVCCSLSSSEAGAQDFPRVETLPDPSTLPSSTALPDPLLMRSGKKVESKDTWVRERRTELKQLFQHYMYGYMPGRPKKVEYTVEREDSRYFNGKATKREIKIQFGPAGTTPIHLLLVIPNVRAEPAPVFVCIAFCGTYAAVDDPTIPVPTGWMYPNEKGIAGNRATEAGRGSKVDTWNIERSIDRGYAIALFYNGDVEPDNKDSRDGVRWHILRKGQTEPSAEDWGAVAAWAWGAQRVVDYLVKDPDIDSRHIGVVGHSRNGKAAIVAGAFDERISMIIPLQAGCGGTSPNRGTVGESVTRINTSFPHWFNANYKKFNDHTDLMPFDQHSLIALCAPRPVFLSNAEEDAWANPAGQFEMLKAADGVYRLFGVEEAANRKMPAPGELDKGRLGYFIRPGKHSMTRQDWDAFLEFADTHFGKPR